MSEAEKKTEVQKETKTQGIAGKRWLAKGIYKSKDVPIRLLDGLILGILIAVVVLVIVFAVNGGYSISFETDGGTNVPAQRLRHGALVEEPTAPQKPGYVLAGWRTSLDETQAEEWNFKEDQVEGELTLYAVWTPAEITVKFDLDGGNWGGKESIPDIQAVFGEAYGSLPIPAKDGYQFDCWIYSGDAILSDTTVATSGEHVLTARWIPE